jgi:hypothetical protein
LFILEHPTSLEKPRGEGCNPAAVTYRNNSCETQIPLFRGPSVKIETTCVQSRPAFNKLKHITIVCYFHRTTFSRTGSRNREPKIRATRSFPELRTDGQAGYAAVVLLSLTNPINIEWFIFLLFGLFSCHVRCENHSCKNACKNATEAAAVRKDELSRRTSNGNDR